MPHVRAVKASMIRVVCQNCGSQLNAKDELAGQTRKCPKCQSALVIPAAPTSAVPETEAKPAAATPATPESTEAATPPAPVAGAAPSYARPERLNRQHRYVICDRNRLFAMWENNGQGWQLRTTSGWIAAARARDQIPPEGQFKLIELLLDRNGTGLRLRGLRTYQIATRYGLNALAQGDDPIVRSITGPAGLGREQKNVLRQVLRDHFMPEVWNKSQQVIDYLAGGDFQAHGVG